ncbi:ATP-dependent RNA helicase-like protein DB10 [Rhododendron vialii]|uniref:ATP-dependent RNA helicase-like protein DB10 n=1 Tax=Rhododendron vialii TaxID=182163 RepID=UPI00265F4C64|nr:ATP-dependent RNA helicase-like protein DB10 [Rhododendron vialii]XP_058180346.1 ATP-dependent RNA helicase-like protein DB10 [Rhododendron vialii]XP_058180347.1 ATP-dependent RNA helicase-like protein DB10 [Rhododendron vialii]
MASATATPRYAPEDPTLPKPWKGLVDGKTGYLYYWNPETNITQYEKPIASSRTGSAPPQKSSAATISSSVQVQQSSQGRHRDSGYDDDDDRYSRGGNATSKLASGTRSYQSGKRGSDHPYKVPNGEIGAGHVASSGRGQGPSDNGNGPSAESYRRRHEISVSGDKVPAPFTSFEDTGFPPEILREVHKAGFSAPTPIQAQSWPIALKSRDIVAVAKTGSGKTLGYLLPGFMHLKRLRNNPQLGPTVLVLSPTRELATQIQEEAVKFGKSSRISSTCLYGGAPKGPQLRDLDRGTDIVVATPGRLNDILEMKRVSLRQVSYLVLDEADRMLDMGFEPQIRKIVKEVPSDRQTLMYTATWPKEVRKIAADLLVNPVQVNIGNIDELVANKAITQHVEIMSPMEKQRRLEQILRSLEPGSKVLIFCTTKKMCDQLTRSLTRQFGAAAIHGDKSQGERDYVLNQFRSGRSPILVATDVAARGLDIKDIRMVINYDFPTGVEDYVHRIGRTGRAGATGVAFTFLSEQDAKHASDLIKVLEGANQRIPVELRDMASRGGGMGRPRRKWGSGSGGREGGHGGRNGLSSSGRDGGRGSWGIPDRVGGRGFDRDSRNSDRYGRSFNDDVDLHGSYHNRVPNERLVRARDGDHRSRSRSRSRSPNKALHRLVRAGDGADRSSSRSRSRSPKKFPGRGDFRRRAESRSRSRSTDRFDWVLPARERSPIRSSQKHLAPSYKSDTERGFKNSVDPPPRSSSGGRRKENLKGSDDDEWGKATRGGLNGTGSSYLGEEGELEEGMIPADEEGMIPADD